MERHRLTELERKLINAVQFDASKSMEEVSREVRVSKHVVAYHLRRMQDANLIRKNRWINIGALGYSEYELALSIAPKRRLESTRFISHLAESPMVAWVIRCGGDFGYSISLVARNIKDIVEFQRQLVRNFGDIFVKQTLLIILKITFFPRKYLLADSPSKSKAKTDCIELALLHGPFSIHANDRKILAHLVNFPLRSVRDVARALGMSPSTVAFRTNKLAEHGVITRSVYSLNTEMIGVSRYRCQIRARSFGGAIRDSLLKFVAQHECTTKFIESIGPWQFEIELEVQTSHEAHQFLEDLQISFGAQLEGIAVVPIFSAGQSGKFLERVSLEDL